MSSYEWHNCKFNLRRDDVDTAHVITLSTVNIIVQYLPTTYDEFVSLLTTQIFIFAFSKENELNNNARHVTIVPSIVHLHAKKSSTKVCKVKSFSFNFLSTYILIQTYNLTSTHRR